MVSRTWLRLAAICSAVLLWSNATAQAGLLQFDSNVTVVAGSSVGSNVFATPTAVHFHGVFDTANTVFNSINSATKFNSLSMDIAGVGSFAAASLANEFLVAANPAFFGGRFAIGITNLAISSGYYSIYSTASNPYTYNALSPNVFSGWIQTASAVHVIPLVGGDNFRFLVASSNPTSSSISSVPEPASLGVWSLVGCIFGVGGLRNGVKKITRAT